MWLPLGISKHDLSWLGGFQTGEIVVLAPELRTKSIMQLFFFLFSFLFNVFISFIYFVSVVPECPCLMRFL